MKSILILLALLLSGCASQVLPPKASPSTLKIDQTIFITPYQYPVYSESLRASIKGTGMFTEVKSGGEKGTKSPTAKVNRRVHGTAVIPLLTFLSLGIIPTIVEEEFGQSFILHHRGKNYGIEATWKGRTILGWLALPLNLSPNRTPGNPEQHPRFHFFLKSKIEEALTR